VERIFHAAKTGIVFFITAGIADFYTKCLAQSSTQRSLEAAYVLTLKFYNV